MAVNKPVGDNAREAIWSGAPPGLTGLLGFRKRLKGDPPTRMAVPLKLMGAKKLQSRAARGGPGPLRLSLLISNEKPRAILPSRQPLNGSSLLEAGAVNPRRGFFRWGFGG